MNEKYKSDERRQHFEDNVMKISNKLNDLCGDYLQQTIINAENPAAYNISSLILFVTTYIASIIGISPDVQDKNDGAAKAAALFEDMLMTAVKDFMENYSEENNQEIAH